MAQYVTPTVSGAHVSIAQSDDLAEEITYTLSGTSSDGEFYMSGSYKATIEFNGLTLTNVTPVYSGAAVHIQNGKRIKVKIVTGTTNTLSDASTGSQKGCLYIKGHAEFAQKGTLNVVGNVKHGIKTGEYMTLKNATINVTSAVGDGISCAEYFLMQSGTVNINGTQDDGIQCDLDGDASTGETTEHEDEDTGNVYLTGGTIIAIGGLESGSSLTQSCYSTSSWSKSTWYALTVGSDTFAFQTPSSGGSTMVVSGASQPTLKKSVTVSSGTKIFDGAGYTNATITGGSNVSLSSYTGGGGGPGGGGRPW